MTPCAKCGKKLSLTKASDTSIIVVDGIVYCLDCYIPPKPVCEVCGQEIKL